MSWRQQAQCADLVDEPRRQWWLFPEPERAQRARELMHRHYCGRCPVWRQCLTVGLAEDHGVYAGTTPEERRAVVRALQRAGQPVHAPDPAVLDRVVRQQVPRARKQELARLRALRAAQEQEKTSA